MSHDLPNTRPLDHLVPDVDMNHCTGGQRHLNAVSLDRPDSPIQRTSDELNSDEV